MKNLLFVYLFLTFLSPAHSMDDDKTILPIPKILNGSDDYENKFQDCFIALHKETPLNRRVTPFDQEDDAKNYMNNYVLPKLFYIDQQIPSWIGNTHVPGFYKKHWIDYQNLKNSRSWMKDGNLFLRPYEIILNKINNHVAALIFNIPSERECQHLNNLQERIKVAIEEEKLDDLIKKDSWKVSNSLKNMMIDNNIAFSFNKVTKKYIFNEKNYSNLRDAQLAYYKEKRIL